MIELIQTYLIVSLVAYFIPTILALFTGNRLGAVFVMNLFLGWTFIGWVWALVWAVSPERKNQVIVNNHIANEAVKPNTQTEQTIEQTIDKASLLNQLSQLHSLRQNNVITEDVYEQERQELLNKLHPEKKAEPTVGAFPSQTVDDNYQNDLEYQKVFGDEGKRKRNKQLIIGLSIAVVFAIGIYLLVETTSKSVTAQPEVNSTTQSTKQTFIETDYKKTCVGNYSFLQDFECGVATGDLEIANARNGKFHFKLSVSGPDNGTSWVMTGNIEGVAKFVTQNVATYSKSDCKKLKFTFFEDGTVRVYETECSTYHGAGVCFEASFIKPQGN